jgi:GNAT superfamily N-acetyltransferase
MKHQHTIVPLAEGDIDRVGAVLARAFIDNPVMTYMCPDESERERLSALLFATFIRYGFLAGEASTTESVDSVAVWLPPGAAEMDADLVSQAGVDKLPSLLGEGPYGRIMKFFARWGELRARDAAFPHWYLTLIGVEPNSQGQGIAGAMLRPMLARADSEGVPIYLETAAPANVPFYRRFGFEMLVDETDSESGVQLWTFLRKPTE